MDTWTQGTCCRKDPLMVLRPLVEGCSHTYREVAGNKHSDLPLFLSLHSPAEALCGLNPMGSQGAGKLIDGVHLSQPPQSECRVEGGLVKPSRRYSVQIYTYHVVI